MNKDVLHRSMTNGDMDTRVYGDIHGSGTHSRGNVEAIANGNAMTNIYDEKNFRVAHAEKDGGSSHHGGLVTHVGNNHKS